MKHPGLAVAALSLSHMTAKPGSLGKVKGKNNAAQRVGWGCLTFGWLSPKYSGPAIAVLGGGGSASPARRRASISALMRFRICRTGSEGWGMG